MLAPFPLFLEYLRERAHDPHFSQPISASLYSTIASPPSQYPYAIVRPQEAGYRTERFSILLHKSAIIVAVKNATRFAKEGLRKRILLSFSAPLSPVLAVPAGLVLLKGVAAEAVTEQDPPRRHTYLMQKYFPIRCRNISSGMLRFLSRRTRPSTPPPVLHHAGAGCNRRISGRRAAPKNRTK